MKSVIEPIAASLNVDNKRCSRSERNNLSRDNQDGSWLGYGHSSPPMSHRCPNQGRSQDAVVRVANETERLDSQQGLMQSKKVWTGEGIPGCGEPIIARKVTGQKTSFRLEE
jgi:hypothetical protein